MKDREISVQSRVDGQPAPAKLMVCDCECEAFGVYTLVDQNHPHLQCLECGTTFCCGDCGNTATTPETSPPEAEKVIAARGQKCRECGCTENNACVTAAGVCHWTEPDLCSACADKSESVPERPTFNALDMLALQRLEPIGVELGAVMAFHILAALQLANRHPGTAGAIRNSVMQFAGGLQEYLSATQNLATLCEAGWNQAHDVGPKGPQTMPRGRIILPGE